MTQTNIVSTHHLFGHLDLINLSIRKLLDVSLDDLTS